MKLTIEYYKRKVDQIKARMAEERLDALLMLDPFNIFYSTGFFYQPSERPLGVLISPDGDPELYVPWIHKDNANSSWISNIKTYFDFPGILDPIIWMLNENAKYKNISIDKLNARNLLKVRDFYPRLSLSNIVYDIRLIKDPEEIEIIRTAGVYADLMVHKIRESIYNGFSELEAYNYSRDQTINAIKQDLGELPYANLGITNGVVLYGEHTAFPHGLMSPSFYPMQGGNCEASIGVLVSGYEAECERTFFYGEPSAKQISFFEAVSQAWKAGFETAKPGIRCSEVNKVALDQIRSAGYEQFLRHRMGHGKGIEEHEPPWIEEGDDTILQPGMIISDEPGLYVPGYAGFRHSDTLLITENGAELLTHYPRNLDHCIIPANQRS